MSITQRHISFHDNRVHSLVVVVLKRARVWQLCGFRGMDRRQGEGISQDILPETSSTDWSEYYFNTTTEWIPMVEPVDGILAVHNAFRHDMERIDNAALEAARGREGLTATIERFRFLDDILDWHAKGEEMAIFPALEKVAPLVAEAYERDHRGLDVAFAELSDSYAAHDPLRIARAAAASRFHLTMHLDKEDAHLYRIFRERIPLPEQGMVMGKMSAYIPQDRFPDVVMWMMPLIRHQDRENITRIWQMVLPAPAFAGVREIIKKAIGSDWNELTRRIPTL